MTATLPTAPSRTYSFTGQSTSNPSAQQPGDKLDAEFDRTNTALAAIITFITTLFNADGSLKNLTVQRAALSQDLQDSIQQLDTAATQIVAANGLKWAEYLAGPVVDPTHAPSFVATTNIPSGLFYDPVAGGPGGLFSAKYWAIQAANQTASLRTQITGLQGQINSLVLNGTTSTGTPTPTPTSTPNAAPDLALETDAGAFLTTDAGAFLVIQ